MGLIFRKQKDTPALTNIGKLSIISFIVSLASAIVSTIWAVYMDSFLQSVVLVGFISASLTLISFTSYFIFIPLIQKLDKTKIYSITLFLYSITYILFAINTKFYIFIILAFIITIIGTLRITSFGIIVKDKSSKKYLSKNEGLIYTFSNIAWVIGPLIAGYISEKFNLSLIFTLSAIFLFIAFVLFKFSKIKDGNIQKNINKNIIKNFIEFFKNKKRFYAYLLGGGVNLWWSLIYLFIPLYIIRNNLGTIWVGYFLFAIAVPLMLLEFHFSKLAGKIGFKKIFITGFLIASICATICFFISNIYIVLGLLVLASIGLAMLEPTTEAYFFDITKKGEECRFYGPYNTTVEVNDFIGKILSATLLVFLPFKFIFLLFGALMLLFVFLSSKIKDVIESKK
jgi:DHA1 family multidrug resistance protein-like MFS transporter